MTGARWRWWWGLGVPVALALGCSTASIKLTYGPPGAPGSGGLFSEGAAALPALQSVEISPRLYGRGCIDVSVRPEDVAITVMQDGSSDWGGFRAAYATAPEIVAAVVSVVSGPVDVVKGLLGIPPRELPAPSPIHGCDGLFED